MYNDDHRMLRDSVASYLSEVSGSEQLRAGNVLVEECNELGWPGLLIEEQYGGAGMDVTSACILAQEIGRNLTLTPMLSSALIAGFVIQEHGTQAQKAHWLPMIADGSALITTTLARVRNHVLAEHRDDALRISGAVDFVPDLELSQGILIPVEYGDQTHLCLLDRDAPGIACDFYVAIDRRQYGCLKLQSVSVPSERQLSAGRLGRTLSFGALLYAAEQIGCAAAAFDMTMEYLRQRKQFGRHIGSFQALQHRASVLYTELSMAEGILLKASVALQRDDDDAEKLCSMAKAKVGRVALSIANEAIQLHGGIGMTDEHDAGLFIKRVTASEKLFGDFDYHTDRVARLSGF